MAAGQLLTLAWQAGPLLVSGTVLLHLVVGVLPIVFLVSVGKALEQLADSLAAGERPAVLSGWLVMTVSAFVLQQLLAPAQVAASQAIARRVDAYCTSRLMRTASNRYDLRGLERPEVASAAHDVAESMDNMALTPGSAAEGALALTARYTQLVGAVVVMVVVAGPWAGLAGLAVALICRRGQTAAFHRWGRHIRSFAPARRRLSYLRGLAVSTRAAKEIRMLGLLDWIDRRYATETAGLLRPLWTWRRRLYGPPFVIYTVLGLIGTVAALVMLTNKPGLGVAGLTVGLQAVVVCARFGVLFPETDVKVVYGRSAWESLLEFEKLAAVPSSAETVGNARARRRTVPAEPGGVRRAGGPDEVVVAGDITFEDVSFSYDEGRPVLDGLNLTIPSGTSTAIVGVNGAGKTTLVKLLTALYRPTGGRIRSGDVDLAEIDPVAWQGSFAVMFQDFVRYELTVRDNVAMSAIHHRDDDEGLLAELARVGLGDLVAALPAGLDTPVTRLAPDGVDLSGGQWQRLALARSLFAVRQGSTLLILDEPTAQLDARGEAEFFDMFLTLTKGITSVVISHRFSSVRRAGQIVTIEGGRARETGTHDELVAAGGTYASLFEIQARRFTTIEGSA
jgi:ATP-binding cassette subfamily B protein